MKNRRNRFSCDVPIAFGEPRAKQSQDDKPLTHQEPVRTASVDYSLWSHLSLRSRFGMKVSEAWPLLPRVSFPPCIPARPFGLGSRSDAAPSDTGTPYEGLSRQKNLAKNAKAAPRYHNQSPLASTDDKEYLSRVGSGPFCVADLRRDEIGPGAPAKNAPGPSRIWRPSAATSSLLHKGMTPTTNRERAATSFGAPLRGRAFVPTASSRQGVSTKGFNPSRGVA